MPAQDASSQSADDLESLVIDVVQDQFVDWEPVAPGVEALDQLRGVGAAAADDRNLYAHSGASYARICANS